MNIFGIGTMEMAVIVIIALIVFGPGRLPEIMGEAGRMLRELRRQTRDLTGDFEESVREVRTTMTDVRGEMRSTMDEIRRETSSVSSSLTESVNDVTKSPTDRPSTRQSVRAAEPGVDTVVSVSVEPEPPRSASAASTMAAPAASKDDPLGDLAGYDDDLLDPKRG
jgi:TatA/E family protein of Tat protein translocase